MVRQQRTVAGLKGVSGDFNSNPRAMTVSCLNYESLQVSWRSLTEKCFVSLFRAVAFVPTSNEQEANKNMNKNKLQDDSNRRRERCR